nr:unnamed protein product [Digitaria exilis]
MSLHALTATFVILALTFVVLVWTRRRRRHRQPPLNLPPGPKGWPVIGSLNLLAGSLPPHRALAALASCHGPFMHLKLGPFHDIVASSAATQGRLYSGPRANLAGWALL